MNRKNIKWGNIALPGLSDEELYGKRWLDRSDFHNEKIGKSLKNKPKSDIHKKNIKKTGTLFGDKDAWNKGKSGYTTKPHSEETKQKMRKKAEDRVIPAKQRKKISNTLSVPIIATNLKTGKQTEYKSTKEASIKLGLTGILHVLKGRSKQCGGYYFEYKNKK